MNHQSSVVAPRSPNNEPLPPEADRRRRVLRMAAGGVPLMSAASVGASPMASASAWRAARADAMHSPDAIVVAPDGWVRSPVQIVQLEPVTPGAPMGSVVRAYKVSSRVSVRYYRVPDLEVVNLVTAGLRETQVVGQAYALVLFRSDGSIVGIDPTQRAGAGGLQGLHCSSWRSIAGTIAPGCPSGTGV